MPYQVPVSLPEILQTTLYLVDHTEHAGEGSQYVEDLRKCLMSAIAELSRNESAGETKKLKGRSVRVFRLQTCLPRGGSGREPIGE